MLPLQAYLLARRAQSMTVMIGSTTPRHFIVPPGVVVPGITDTAAGMTGTRM